MFERIEKASRRRQIGAPVEVSQALEAMPRRPAPAGSTPRAFDLDTPGLGPGNYGIQHSDETLRTHEAKIFDYESRLREWVTDLEAARADRLRLVETKLRLHELGYAPADHVHMRLFIPEGFELEDEARRPSRRASVRVEGTKRAWQLSDRVEASAAGLNRPARGTITFQVQEPSKIEPITTLEEAKQERMDLLLH